MARRELRGASIERAESDEPIIVARNLELKTPLGCPFSGVSLNVRQGQVVAIRGRNGSGKTALLLTLAGRMLFTKGSLQVLGDKLPRYMGRVQKRVGLAFFEGQNDLDSAQRVRHAVAAEFDLHGRRISREEVADYLQEWHLEDKANMRVSELSQAAMVNLGVALAWVGHPDIIMVDDIEEGLTKDQSIEIMNRLLQLAHERNVAIVVGVLERDLAAMADHALYLGEGHAQVSAKPTRAGDAPVAS